MDETANVERGNGTGEGLEQLKQRFGRWREGRTGSERIPQELWSAAVAMAKQHRVYRVSRTLRLDYNGLKKLVGPVVAAKRPARRTARRAATVDTQFVELFAAPPAKACAACECTVELHNVRGAKMRVELNGAGLAGLERLCSSFWSAR